MLSTFLDTFTQKLSLFLDHPLSLILSIIGGLICYYISPSFKTQLVNKKPLRIVASIVMFLSLLISWLLAKRRRTNTRPYLRITVYCLVFLSTCVYSFYEQEIEEEEEGSKNNPRYESLFDLFSYVAFSLAAFSISRKIELGFEVGMFCFFLQSAMATALNMNHMFIAVGTGVFCCFVIGIRIYLEHSQQQETQIHEASNSHHSLQLPVKLPALNPSQSHRLLHVPREPLPAPSLVDSSKSPQSQVEKNHVDSKKPRQKFYDVFVSFVYDKLFSKYIAYILFALLGKDFKIAPMDFALRTEEEQMSPAYLSSIEASKLSLVFFTKDYASSLRHLDELEKIMECRSQNEQIVIPIFLEDVESLSDTYGDALAEHELKVDSHKVQSWSDAMFEVAQVNGWQINGFSDVYPSQVLDGIIEDVWRKLNPSNPQVSYTYTGVYLSFSAQDKDVAFAKRLLSSLIFENVIVRNVQRPDLITRGYTESESRIRALEISKISLIIFSEGYAKSEECLDEVLKAMECRKKNTQIVIPIYYDVLRSEVKNQEGKFEVANFEDAKKVEMWKHALGEAAQVDVPSINYALLGQMEDKEGAIAKFVATKFSPNDRKVESSLADEVTDSEMPSKMMQQRTGRYGDWGERRRRNIRFRTPGERELRF